MNLPEMSENNNGSADFDFVPIVEVTADNIKDLEPCIRAAIANSDLVSIDCELSGLGDRKKLNASCIEDRYNFTGIAAKTRSIISLGLSTFRRVANDATNVKAATFQVQTFDIMVLCSEDYIVEPASLKFLVEHGFNFINQYSKGLPYHRGNDKPGPTSPLRRIFAELIMNKKPLVLHNGLIDLVFLYQNFYAQLPVTLEVFLADLADMFPAGIYDTKFLADYICRMQSSFLEFVFKMLQRRNLSRSEKDQLHVKMSFQSYPEHFLHLDRRSCKTVREDDDELDSVEVCNSYADHGHCNKGQNCDKSHNIDRIVRQKVDGKRRKVETSEFAVTKLKLERQNGNSESSAGHRAGFDAFMTGFSFLVFLTSKSEKADDSQKVASSLLGGRLVHPDLNEESIRNKIYLVSKDIPLLVKKSNFAKNSICHAEKIAKLRKEV